MSALLKGIQRITPQTPVNAPREYDGLEWRYKAFVFRPATFSFEAIMLGVLGAYLGLYFLGKSVNNGRAQKTMAPVYTFLQTQFTAVRPLVSSSSALHLLYATGRRNVLSLTATLKLMPLHDVISLAWDFVNGLIDPTYQTSESVEYVVTLGRGSAGLQEGAGVWAILEKGVMGPLRKKRFDLSFPRLFEHATMPISHALFAEHNDVTDLLLKTHNIGISELLAKPAATKVLKYFIVTDQPSQRPMRGPLRPEQRSREVVLGVSKPSTAEDEAAVNAWTQVALNVADLLAKPNLIKPEVMRKLAKTRVETDASLAKQFRKEQEEDGEIEPEAKPEDKKAAKKRAERAAMSEKELKKAEELQRKRDMRKMQKKGQK